MSKSKKGARGKTVDLASFVENAPDNSLDWARDEFAPTPPVRPQEGGEVPPLDGKKSNRTFGFKAGSMGGNFREEEAIQLSTVVPLDMVAPFVAYVGNLPHNIAGSVVEEQFVGVTSVRVIKHDKSTFAYVEFDSRDDLQNAIYCTGKMVGGRKIKVDVASDAQRERLVDERNRGANSPAGDAFAGGRDGMGTAQPRRGMGSRNPSSNDVSFSRDNMGAAQPSSNDLGTPTTSGSPLPDFSRAVFGAVQQKSPNSAGGRANFRERSSKPASPVVSGTPNFRDGPQVAQPDLADWRTSEKAEQPATPVVPAATFARRNESDQKETKTSDEPKKTTPTETKKPAAENPWRRGPPAEAPKGDDRFAALRS